MSNTVEKGNAFEKRVFDLLKKLVENGDFFVPGRNSKVFWKKKYYSEKRKADIIFDITIETYINNASTYSLLTIVECKNVGKPVTVDDVEEFESKISQVGEHNTKGIIVSNNSFQEGAYNLAVSLKIALIRLTSNDEYEWISYRKPKFIQRMSQSETALAFINDKLEGRNLIAYVNDHPVYNLSDVLIETGIIDFYWHKESFIRIPFVTEERIEEIIKRLMKHGVYNYDKLDTTALCSLLADSYKMEFDFGTYLPNNILGKIEFDPLKISVTIALKEDENRWRFTLAHEVGHLILHSSLLRYSIDEKTDGDSSLSLDNNISEVTSRQLEFQANLFARHLLIPDATLIKVVSEYFKQENIHRGFLYLDSQPVNRNLVFTFLSKMSNHFGVSIEAAKVRLKALGLLRDATDNSMSSHMRRMGYK